MDQGIKFKDKVGYARNMTGGHKERDHHSNFSVSTKNDSSSGGCTPQSKAQGHLLFILTQVVVVSSALAGI